MKTWYLLWIALHAVLVDAQIPVVESITIASDLSTARYCVSWCIAISNFGCSVNSCYCAPYLRSTVNSDVSSCVTGVGSCPDSSDVIAATSAISSYCDKYYAAVGATPSAVPTSAIQDTSINVLPGSTPTSTPSATATSSPFSPSLDSPISNTAKIVGIVVGGGIGLFGAIVFLYALYRFLESRRRLNELKQLQYLPPSQAGAPQKAKTTKRWSLGAQIASALLGLAGVIVAIYFGIKPRSPS